MANPFKSFGKDIKSGFKKAYENNMPNLFGKGGYTDQANEEVATPKISEIGSVTKDLFVGSFKPASTAFNGIGSKLGSLDFPDITKTEAIEDIKGGIDNMSIFGSHAGNISKAVHGVNVMGLMKGDYSSITENKDAFIPTDIKPEDALKGYNVPTLSPAGNDYSMITNQFNPDDILKGNTTINVDPMQMMPPEMKEVEALKNKDNSSTLSLDQIKGYADKAGPLGDIGIKLGDKLVSDVEPDKILKDAIGMNEKDINKGADTLRNYGAGKSLMNKLSFSNLLESVFRSVKGFGGYNDLDFRGGALTDYGMDFKSPDDIGKKLDINVTKPDLSIENYGKDTLTNLKNGDIFQGSYDVAAIINGQLKLGSYIDAPNLKMEVNNDKLIKDEWLTDIGQTMHDNEMYKLDYAHDILHGKEEAIHNEEIAKLAAEYSAQSEKAGRPLTGDEWHAYLNESKKQANTSSTDDAKKQMNEIMKSVKMSPANYFDI